jgi:hypothetical protein
MLLALYLCVYLGFKKIFLTDILCTYGQNNDIRHIKQVSASTVPLAVIRGSN